MSVLNPISLAILGHVGAWMGLTIFFVLAYFIGRYLAVRVQKKSLSQNKVSFELSWLGVAVGAIVVLVGATLLRAIVAVAPKGGTFCDYIYRVLVNQISPEPEVFLIWGLVLIIAVFAAFSAQTHLQIKRARRAQKGSVQTRSNEISLEEYKKIYIKTVKELARRDVFWIPKVAVLMIAATGGFGIWTWQQGDYVVIETIAILAALVAMVFLMALWALIDTSARYRWIFSKRAKMDFADIEALNKTYRKLMQDTTRVNFLIVIGIFTSLLAIAAIVAFILIGVSPATIQAYTVFAVIVGVLSLSAFGTYKIKMSEVWLEVVEEKVRDNAGLIQDEPTST